MKRDIKLIREIDGVSGIVIGALTKANKVDKISEENLIENSNVRDNEKEDMGLNKGKDYQTNRKRKREREKCESKQNDLEV